MKRQLAAAVAMAGMTVVGSMTPVVAHHPEVTDGGGTSTAPDKYEGLGVRFDRDWAMPASAGKDKGSAPDGSAPCINAMAADFFPCDGIDLLSHVSHRALGTSFVNDTWGWTDPVNKPEQS